MRAVLIAALYAAGCMTAQAQAVVFTPIIPPSGSFDGVLSGPVDPANDYVSVLRIAGRDLRAPGARLGDALLSINDLVAAASGASQAQLSSTLVGIANRIDRLNSRFSEGIALAGSFNVLPPNPGDRFAVSVGGAGFNGYGAASISASARIDESTIVYGGIAQGASQTMVKGGLGWSFR